MNEKMSFKMGVMKCAASILMAKDFLGVWHVSKCKSTVGEL